MSDGESKCVDIWSRAEVARELFLGSLLFVPERGTQVDLQERDALNTKKDTRIRELPKSEGGSGSDYKDDDPLTWTSKDPEYLIIPWDAQGNKLTVKLTLWFLAMMATNGDRYLDYSNPDLNNWRRDGMGYVHNTSGAKKSELAKGDKEQEPDPG